MITIRRLRTGEGALFKRIRLAALKDSPSAFLSTYEAALTRSDESWCAQADSTAQGSERATFIACSANEPIGITAIYRDNERVAVGELLQVWIAPEYRGTGVARDLMSAVFWWAGENNFREIIATVASGNASAQRFYEKSGFTLAACFSHDGPDDPVLTKKLET